MVEHKHGKEDPRHRSPDHEEAGAKIGEERNAFTLRIGRSQSPNHDQNKKPEKKLQHGVELESFRGLRREAGAVGTETQAFGSAVPDKRYSSIVENPYEAG